MRDLVPLVQFKNVKNTDGCFSHVLNRTNGTKSRKTSNYIADRDKLLFCEDGEDKLVNKLFLELLFGCATGNFEPRSRGEPQQLNVYHYIIFDFELSPGPGHP